MGEAKEALKEVAKKYYRRWLLRIVLPVILIFSAIIIFLGACAYLLKLFDSEESNTTKAVTSGATVSGTSGISVDTEDPLDSFLLEEKGFKQEEIDAMTYAEKMRRAGLITKDQEEEALTEVLGADYTEEQVANMTEEEQEQLKEIVDTYILDDVLYKYGYTEEEISGWNNKTKSQYIEVLEWGNSKEEIEEMTEEEFNEKVQLNAGADLYIAAKVIWETDDRYSKRLKTVTQLEKLINAELVTQYPKLNEELIDGLNGVVRFMRVSSDGTERELEQMDYDQFQQKVENADSDILNYFAMDEEGNVVVATWKSVTTETGGLYPDGVENSDAPDSSTEYTITTTSVNYKSMVSSYTMPFNYLWTFMVMGDDIDLVMDLADLVYDSDIQISLYDKITVITETTTRTTDEEITVTGTVVLENGNTQSIPSLKEYNSFSQVTTIVTTTDTIEQHLTYADVWAAVYVHKYKYVDNTTSSSENVVEYGDTGPNSIDFSGASRAPQIARDYAAAVAVVQDTTVTDIYGSRSIYWYNTKDTIVTTSDSEKIQEIASQKAVPKTIEGFKELDDLLESLDEESTDSQEGEDELESDNNSSSVSDSENNNSSDDNGNDTESNSNTESNEEDDESSSSSSDNTESETNSDDESLKEAIISIVNSIKNVITNLSVEYEVEITEQQQEVYDRVLSLDTYDLSSGYGEAWVEWVILGHAGEWGCATEAGDLFIIDTSQDNIPIGACVYGETSGTGDNYIEHDGHDAGRVAIYLGNGNVGFFTQAPEGEEGGVEIFTLDEFINERGYGWRGWGWLNNIDLSEGDKTTVTIKINQDSDEEDDNTGNTGDTGDTSGETGNSSEGGNNEDSNSEEETSEENQDESQEEDPNSPENRPSFHKAFKDNLKGRNNILEIKSWLFEALEANEDTANMVDLTRYLLNEVQDTTRYGDVEWEDIESMFYPGNNWTSLIGDWTQAETVEEKVWLALRSEGYSEIAVAGVMGNIYAESSFNAGTIESGSGIGIGLCQWSYGRRTQLEAYAASKGVDWTDEDTQIEFLIGELTPGGGANGYASYQLVTYNGYSPSDWENATTVEEATQAFCWTFERPGIPRMEVRIEAALNYYEQFQGYTLSVIGNGDFLEIAKQCHDYVKENEYTYGNGIPINSEKIVDCSGYVCWVLQEYGYTEFGSSIRSTYDFVNNISGNTFVGYDNWEVYAYDESILQAGDILLRNGHMAIYAGNGMAYDCGDTSVIQSEWVSISWGAGSSGWLYIIRVAE